MHGRAQLQKPAAIRNLEERVLKLISFTIAIVVTPSILFVQLTELYADRYDPTLGALFAVHLALMGVIFFARGTRPRTVLILVYLLVAGCAGLLHYGPTMTVGLAFLAAPLLANIYLGARATWLVLAVVVSVFASTAALFVSGRTPCYHSEVRDLGDPFNWLRIGLFSLTTITAVILIFGMLLRRLELVAHEAQAALEGIQRERDERRSAEIAFIGAQRHEIVSRVASGAAHDLNNILTAVKGAADMASLATRSAQGISDDLSIIKEGVYRAAVLTRQLLSFGRQRAPDRSRVDLAGILLGLQGIIERLVSCDIALTVDAPAGLPAVQGDPAQIEQIVLNLCVNARDAMPNGGRLEMSATRENDGVSDRVVLRVSDSGTGIPEDVQTRMFEPFYTTKPEGRGTGLGLATVRLLAESHGASVSCRSAVGEGTVMSVSFPTADDVEKSPWAPRLATPSTDPGGGCESILVCDPDELSRETAVRILRGAGYTVASAGDLTAALRAISGDRFDLTIVDAKLGGLSGAELDVELRRARPEQRALCTTGLDPAALRRQMRGRHILTKPFGRADLLIAVRRALDESERSR